MKSWTKQEENFLKVNWTNMNLIELVEALNKKFRTKRSKSSVNCKINRLKLPSKRDHDRNNSYNRESQIEIQGRIKTIEINRIKELLKGKDNLKLRVKNDNKRELIRLVNGVVIQKNDSFIVIKFGNYNESFRYTDFLTGRAVIM